MYYKRKDGQLIGLSEDKQGFSPKVKVIVEGLTYLICEKCNEKIWCTQEEKADTKAFLIKCRKCKHVQSYGCTVDID